MRRSGRILVVLTLMLATLSMHAFASAEWRWQFNAEPPGDRLGWSALLAGVNADSLDGIDTRDRLQTRCPNIWLGSYREAGVDGWDGQTGFYEYDFRVPLTGPVGTSKKWDIYVWNGLSLPSDVTEFRIQWSSTDLPDDVMVTAKLVAKPEGITSGPDVGTVWYPPYTILHLPTYRTADGLKGYHLEMVATIIPEPSSLAALGGGVMGLLALRRRRRR